MKLSIAENPFCEDVSLSQAIMGDHPRSDMFIASQSLEEGSGNTGGGYIVTAEDGLPDLVRREAVGQDTLDNLISPNVPVALHQDGRRKEPKFAMLGSACILREHKPIVRSEVHVDQLLKISKRTWRQYSNCCAPWLWPPVFPGMLF
jgi:hypothetical protein